MNETCGCCEGIEQLTPLAIANRPGLDVLFYRVGTHASFLETMVARLSNLPLRLGEVDILLSDPADQNKLIYPLQGLTTRADSDPAIALLDAWATVAHVLTFYQERIANEGYLRTATERRSVLELARLVGYVLRPGVAASVFLAYTLEKDHSVIILPGNRAQSKPDPGELPQSFETAEKLEARFDWNTLKPRLTQPQFITQASTQIRTNTKDGAIYFKGTTTHLKERDPLLFVFSDTNQVFTHVITITPQAAENRTRVTVDPTPLVPMSLARAMALSATRASMAAAIRNGNGVTLRNIVDRLKEPPSLQPPNTQRLERSATQAFSAQSDIHLQLLVNLTPALQGILYSAISNAPGPVSSQPVDSIQAFRVKAAPFGHNIQAPGYSVVIPLTSGGVEQQFSLPLDAEYEITKGGWAVIERKDEASLICKVVDVQAITMGGTQSGDLSQFSTSGVTITTKDKDGNTISQTTSDPIRVRVTVLKLSAFGQDPSGETNLVLQDTTIHAQSERRDLAEQPSDEEIRDNTVQTSKVGTDIIELDRLYDGLHSGQRLIVSGERTDVISNKVTVTGVKASELVMLKNVRQDVQQVQDPTDSTGKKTIPLPGDKKHTFLQFANALQFTYNRDTLIIYANVVRTTHGETRSETLGSGDSSKALQQFALRQSPLTYVSASTPAGAESTLQVRINDILWHEVDSLPGLKPTDRSFITETDDAGKTTVLFGNGKYGARLPTGVENVKAVYRTGIGKPGNVKAEQITLLSTKPLGVKAVVNPIKASGGADRENRDQARRNVPLAAIALDRLVSVQDYEDFARTFAGIGKASAVPLSDRHRQLVHLSIAGADNIPIDTTSDLYRNLFQALRQFGDPNQPLTVEIAEVEFIVISAKVRLLPDYLLESVEPKIRTKLLDTFSFDRRELGQSVFQSEVLSVIQSIAGVDYVDLEILGTLDETTVVNTLDAFTKKPLLDQEEKGEPPETDEAGETAPEELAEEFLEALGLTGHDDVAVNLAKMNPNPPQPPVPPKPFLVAQLAFLSPDVPDTLIITELPK